MRVAILIAALLITAPFLTMAAKSRFEDLDDDLFGDLDGSDGGNDDLFGDESAGSSGARASRGAPKESDISELDPDTIDEELENPKTNFVGRGIKFAESGNEAVALRYFRAALKFESKNPNAWLNLGTCLMNKAHAVARKQIPRGRAQKKLFSELNEAVQAFNTGLALKPRRQDSQLLLDNRKLALRGLHEIFPRKCPKGICKGADTSPIEGTLPDKWAVTEETVGPVPSREEMEKERAMREQQQQQQQGGGAAGGRPPRGQRAPIDDEEDLFGEEEEVAAPPKKQRKPVLDEPEDDDEDLNFLFEDAPKKPTKEQADDEGDDSFDFGADDEEEKPKKKTKPEGDRDTWDL